MTTSDDAKDFLVTLFVQKGEQTRAAEWKRRSKSRDGLGRTQRVFDHPRIGLVTVLSTDGGFALVDAPGTSVAAAAPERPDAPRETFSGFTAPVFTQEQLAAAETVQSFYYDTVRSQSDEDEKFRSHPAYAAALPALGTQLGFFFPSLTYGNGDAQGKTLDDPMGDCCVVVFDPTPGSDVDEYADTPFRDSILAAGWDAIDEYHYESTTNRTVRQAVQSLLGLGLRYAPQRAVADWGEPCLFERALEDAGALTPKPVAAPSPARASRPKP